MKYITEGKPLKMILIFAVPILIGNIFHQLYSMINTAIISQVLGINSLAAIGAASPIVNLVFGLTSGLSIGLSVLIGQSYGARDNDKLKKYVASSIVIGLGIIIIFSIIAVSFSFLVLNLLGTPQEVINLSNSYLIIILLGLIITMMYNLCASILRAIGDKKTITIRSVNGGYELYCFYRFGNFAKFS